MIFSVKRCLLYKYKSIKFFFHIYDICVYIFKILRKDTEEKQIIT